MRADQWPVARPLLSHFSSTNALIFPETVLTALELQALSSRSQADRYGGDVLSLFLLGLGTPLPSRLGPFQRFFFFSGSFFPGDFVVLLFVPNLSSLGRPQHVFPTPSP